MAFQHFKIKFQNPMKQPMQGLFAKNSIWTMRLMINYQCHLLQQQLTIMQENYSLFAKNQDNQFKTFIEHSPRITKEEISSKSSSFLKEYRLLLGPSPEIDCQQLQKKMQKNQIVYKKQAKYTKFTYQVIKITRNFQILEIKVKISKFQLTLFLLNILGSSTLSQISQFQQGSFGKIYFNTFFKQKIAVKSFQFQNPEKREQIIAFVIRQFSIFKISSLLECSPAIVNDFGFDLVVYDDCIQFVVQKGEKISKLTKTNSRALKKQLLLLHSFNIVHFDIKPENLCFSPQYNKVVFIDLGLSDIVQQNLGFKSFTTFKGSPSFCIVEMFKLFTNQNCSEFIDLYYNDAVCLKNTTGKMNTLSQLVSSEQFQQRVQTDSQCPQHKLFYLISFKFHILKQNQIIIKNILNITSYFLEQFGKNILIFLKQLPFNTFNQNLFINELKSLKNMEEYNVLKAAVKQQAQLMHISLIKPKKCINKIEQYFRERFYHHFQYEKQELIQFNEKDLIEHIQNLSKRDMFTSQLQTQCILDFFIRHLRFDMKNYSMKIKMKIVHKFNLLIKNTAQQNDKNQMNFLQNVFEYLLKYCITPPLNEWKKLNIMMILLQCVILDINVLEYIYKIEEAIYKMGSNHLQLLLFGIEITHIVNVSHLKHIHQNQKDIHMVIDRLSQLKLKLINLAVHSEAESSYESLGAVKKVLQQITKYYQQNKILSFQGLNKVIQLFQDVENNKNKIKIKKLVIYQFLQNCYLQGNYQTSLKVHNQIKRQLSKQSQQCDGAYIHFGVYYQYHHNVMLKNNRELKYLQSFVEAVINCQQIYAKFKFRMGVFLFSDDNNQIITDKYLEEMSKVIPNSLFSIKLNYQFIKLIDKIIPPSTQFTGMSDKRKKIIYQIFQIFISYKSEIWQSGEDFSNEECQIIMFRLMAQNFFSQVSKSNLRFDVLLSILNSQLTKQIQPIKKKYLILKFYSYSSLYLKTHGQYQSSFQHYTKLLQASRDLNNYKLRDYCFVSLLQLTKYVRKGMDYQITYRHLLKTFYRLDRFELSLMRYFNLNNHKIIAQTLWLFLRYQNYDKLQIFLTELAEFIGSYPLNHLFLEWFQNIQLFINKAKRLKYFNFTASELKCIFGKIGWKNRYLIIYFFFAFDFQQNRQNKQNTLKIIALRLNELSSFACQFLIVRYYHQFLSTMEVKERKQIQILQKLNWGSIDKKQADCRFKKIWGKLRQKSKTDNRRKIEIMKNKLKLKCNIY